MCVFPSSWAVDENGPHCGFYFKLHCDLFEKVDTIVIYVLLDVLCAKVDMIEEIVSA